MTVACCGGGVGLAGVVGGGAVEVDEREVLTVVAAPGWMGGVGCGWVGIEPAAVKRVDDESCTSSVRFPGFNRRWEGVQRFKEVDTRGANVGGPGVGIAAIGERVARPTLILWAPHRA